MSPSTTPSGNLTFLFTDIEGSTRLWEQHPAIMREALARHDQILTKAIESHGGHIFKTVGDAFCAAFRSAPDAVGAAQAAQERLRQEHWEAIGQLRVRIALHSGTTEERNQDYFGPVLNRLARLLGIGHGGQVLLSQEVQSLVMADLPPSVFLQDLGSHRLKDLTTAERVFQLCAPGLPAAFPPLKSLSPQTTNLPIQATSFIGRDREVAEVKSLLNHTRLLTLTGSGGCGKTRLSLQAAADLTDRFPEGVWLTELAPLSDPEQVTRAVASALGIKEAPERDLTATIVEALRPKKLLLILDNCEHVRDAAARLTNELLRNCGDLFVLASSREGLGIPGEVIYQVPSLALPDLSTPLIAEETGRYDAIRLFVERARLTRPDFTLSNQNALNLTRICYRLDGIPLALELAAARVRMMSVEQIETRLNDRFRLLTGGSRVAAPRQQTLRGLIDWSYQLLSAPEKTLFHRLATFAGGCTLEACEAVGAGGEIESWEVLDLLTALVDKSLVVYQEGSTPRYRLLESIREYAQERLQGSEDNVEASRQHRDFFLTWTLKQADRLATDQPSTIYQEVDADYENVRRALEWSEARNVGIVLQMANALTRYWYERGLLTEGRRWLRTALKASEVEDDIRARSLNSAGIFAMTQGDLTEAQTVYEESLRLYLAQNNTTRVAACYNNLGLLAHARQDFDAMEDYHQQSLAIYRRLGNTEGIVATLSNLGLVASDRKEYRKAWERFEEALEITRPTGDAVKTATILQNLGTAAAHLDDLPFARSCLNESITMHVAAGVSNTVSVANALIELSRLAMDNGQNESAVRMVGVAQAVLDRLGAQLPEVHQGERAEILSELKTRLEPQVYETLWAEGLALSPETVPLMA